MSRLEKRNRCKFCKKFFFLKSALETHEVAVHKSEEENKQIFAQLNMVEVEEEVEAKIFPEDTLTEIVEFQMDAIEDGKKLKCHICGKTFNLKTALKTHLIGHNAPELQWCEICDKKFTTLKSFKAHMMDHEMKKQIMCSICLQQFPNEKLCNSHIKRFHKPSKPKSNRNKEIKGMKGEINCGSLGIRIEKKEKSSTLKCSKPKPVTAHNYVCKICKEMCSSKSSFQDHMKIHEDLICPICDKKCSNIQNLKSHVIFVHSKKYVLCDLCGKSMVKSAYRLHLRIHTGEKPYQCSRCGKSFVQKQHLLRHEKCHDEKPFRCKVCGRGYHTEEDLNFHSQVHKEDFSCLDETGRTISQIRRERSSYECEICNETFNRWQSLTKHEKEFHPELRFTCQICSKEFLYSSQLRIHYSNHSDKELEKLDENTRALIKRKKLLYTKCVECNENVSKYHMKTHMRKHTGEKPFECHFCGKGFRLKVSLQVHERIHTGHKPFQCDICNKTFSQYCHLRHHLLLHSTDKPYQCRTCGKNFATRDYLSNHEKIHTRDSNTPTQRRLPCLLCGKRFRSKSNHRAHQLDCQFKMELPEEEAYDESDTHETVEIYEYVDSTLEHSTPSIQCVTEIHHTHFEGPLILKIEENEVVESGIICIG